MPFLIKIIIVLQHIDIKRGIIMHYKTLYNLFFYDTEKYNQYYADRYNHEDTIRLEINIGSNPAFVYPNSEMYAIMLSIERTNSKVNSLCDRLPDAALFQFAKHSLINEIVITNNIEGVHSTRKEIGEILENLQRNKTKRFYGLVKKYQALTSEKEIKIKTCQDIRNIYNDIFYDEVKSYDPDNLPDGVIFRKSGVDVLSPTAKVFHRGVLPEQKIIEVMNSALQMLNNENIDYLIRISLFHYLFGYIHPFYDGNGRLSRFISSYLLSQNLNSLISYNLSYIIKEKSTQYYEAFKKCNDERNKGDVTPFILMFLSMIDLTMQRLLEVLTDEYNKFLYFIEVIKKSPKVTERTFGLYSLLIQASLFSDNGLSIKDISRELDCNELTVRRRLNEIDQDIIVKTKNGRQILYMLDLEKIE